MKKILIVLTILFGLFTACTENKSAKDVIVKVKDNYGKHASISYDINFRQKFASEDDTVSLRAKCQLLRDASDSLIGGNVWFLVNDTFETYYNKSRFYFADRGAKTLIDCEGTEDNASFVYGTIRGASIRIGFLDIENILAKVMDTANRVTCTSEEGHYLITVNPPDNERMSETAETFHVRKDDFVIERGTFKTKFQGHYEYSDWSISNVSFDKMSLADLNHSMEEYKHSYILKPYPTVYVPLLEAGTMAPFFNGADVTSGNQISLKDYKGKFLLIDFSYMSCMPCIKAIPHLNKIKEANKNLAVVCLNSKDNSEKDKKRIPEFIKNNDLRYQMILTDSKTDSLYQVTGYPTVYLIDKSGKIIFSEVGYNETLSDTLQAIINRN